MAVKNSRYLGRLRRIIQKVKFLLSFNTRRWFLSSRMGFLLSTKAQQGLLDLATGADEDYYEVDSRFGLPRTTSSINIRGVKDY